MNGSTTTSRDCTTERGETKMVQIPSPAPVPDRLVLTFVAPTGKTVYETREELDNPRYVSDVPDPNVEDIGQSFGNVNIQDQPAYYTHTTATGGKESNRHSRRVGDLLTSFVLKLPTSARLLQRRLPRRGRERRRPKRRSRRQVLKDSRSCRPRLSRRRRPSLRPGARRTRARGMARKVLRRPTILSMLNMGS